MLLMVEKSIREGICQSIYQYAEANNIHEIIIKIENRHIFSIGM